MSTALQANAYDRRQQTAALDPDPRPGTEFLTVTAHPVPPATVVIMARGEVDLLTSPLLLDGLMAHLHAPTLRLIVDLTAVDFLGAAGLTVLVTTRQVATAVGIGLCLVAPTRPVLLPLTITRLHTQIDIYPTVAQALSDLAAGGEPAARSQSPDGFSQCSWGPRGCYRHSCSGCWR